MSSSSIDTGAIISTGIKAAIDLTATLGPIIARAISGQVTDEQARAEVRAAISAFEVADAAARAREDKSDAARDAAIEEARKRIAAAPQPTVLVEPEPIVVPPAPEEPEPLPPPPPVGPVDE